MASSSGRRPVSPAAAARAVGRSAELVTQASDAASEFVRKRRDPAAVVSRRRRRAKRAAVAYGAAGLGTGALGASRLAGELSAPTVVIMIVLLLVAAWCLAGAVRNALAMRRADRELSALPAPAPARPAVDPAVRPVMRQLDGYSDGLRRLTGLIGVSAVKDDPSLVALRRDILQSADAAERRLRRQAVDLSGLLRARAAAPAPARADLEATARSLADEIRVGVDGYGQLVTAAGESVAASRALSSSLDPAPSSVAGAAPGLSEATDRLRALAAGMRELTDGRG